MPICCFDVFASNDFEKKYQSTQININNGECVNICHSHTNGVRDRSNVEKKNLNEIFGAEKSSQKLFQREF